MLLIAGVLYEGTKKDFEKLLSYFQADSTWAEKYGHTYDFIMDRLPEAEFTEDPSHEVYEVFKYDVLATYTSQADKVTKAIQETVNSSYYGVDESSKKSEDSEDDKISTDNGDSKDD